MGYKTLKQEHREIFNEDLKLIGFNKDEIERELELLKTCDEEIDYIKASRVGFTVKLTRGERKAIYLSYEIWVKDEI